MSDFIKSFDSKESFVNKMIEFEKEALMRPQIR